MHMCAMPPLYCDSGSMHHAQLASLQREWSTTRTHVPCPPYCDSGSMHRAQLASTKLQLGISISLSALSLLQPHLDSPSHCRFSHLLMIHMPPLYSSHNWTLSLSLQLFYMQAL